MARQQQQGGREQQGSQSPAEQQQHQQQGAAGTRGTGVRGAAVGGTGGGAGTTTGGGTSTGGGAAFSGAHGGTEPRGGERERSVPSSREGEAGGGAGPGVGSTMQRSQGGSVRGGDRGMSRQPGLMSSVISGDPFAVADQMMMSPFSFMRRFSEEMDRLFADYGFGPGGYGSTSYGSTGYGPAGYGLTSGGASSALGDREVGGGQQRRLGLQHQPGRQGSTAAGLTRSSVWAPQIELFQRGDQIVVRADLPGLNKDDVDVEVHEGVLTISGERREQHEDRGEGFFHSERSYGSFHRSIPLPEGVSEDQINAQFRDGVLEVTIPVPRQQEQQRARRIEIRS